MRSLTRLVVVLALVLVSCGGGEPVNGNNTGPGGGSEDLTLTIESPADGDEVSLPVTLEFASSMELGPIDTGAHHVHVYFDGNDAEYEVVEAATFELTALPPGTHTIHASLRNADHSDTGVEDVIEVTVTGGGGGGGGGNDDKGGYDY